MRPNTLAEAIERIRDGELQDVALAEFIDSFLSAETAMQYRSIEQEPEITNDARLDALVGAIAEYLAKQHRLGRVPQWAYGTRRRLDEPWFTTSSTETRDARIPRLCKPRRIPLTQHIHRGAPAPPRSREGRLTPPAAPYSNRA